MKRFFTVLLLVVLSLTALTVQAQTYDPTALARYFPAETDVYAGLRIDDGYLETLDGILASILNKLPEDLKSQIPPITLRQALLGSLPPGVTYEDIRQWLGDYAAFGASNLAVTMDDDVSNDDAALAYVVVAIKDKAALEAFIVEQIPDFSEAVVTTAGDFTIYSDPENGEGKVALSDTVAIFTNAPELPAGGLNTDADFVSTIGKMPAESYNIFLYVKSSTFATAAQTAIPAALGENPLESLEINTADLAPVAVGLTILEGRSLTIDILSPGLSTLVSGAVAPQAVDPAFIQLIPADISYVAHFTDLASSLTNFLNLAATASEESDNPMSVEQISNLFNGLTGLDLNEDVLSWMGGDAALIADADIPTLLEGSMNGTLSELPLAFGIMIETDGSDRPAAVVEALGRILTNQAPEEEVTVTNETINGVPAVVITGEAEGMNVPLEIVIGATDSLFVLATRPLAEQIFSGDYAGLDVTPGYQEAAAYLLPNSSAVLFTDNTFVGDLVVLFVGGFSITMEMNSTETTTPETPDFRSMLGFAYNLVSSTSISSTTLDSGETLTRAVLTLAN